MWASTAVVLLFVSEFEKLKTSNVRCSGKSCCRLPHCGLHILSYCLRMPSEDLDPDPNWDPVLLAQPETKRAKLSGSSSISSEGSIPVSQGSDIVWNSLDIAKAGTLLGPDSSNVVFHDEDEMRRVFTLLYDVFRCESLDPFS